MFIYKNVILPLAMVLFSLNAHAQTSTDRTRRIGTEIPDCNAGRISPDANTLRVMHKIDSAYRSHKQRMVVTVKYFDTDSLFVSDYKREWFFEFPHWRKSERRAFGPLTDATVFDGDSMYIMSPRYAIVEAAGEFTEMGFDLLASSDRKYFLFEESTGDDNILGVMFHRWYMEYYVIDKNYQVVSGYYELIMEVDDGDDFVITNRKIRYAFEVKNKKGGFSKNTFDIHARPFRKLKKEDTFELNVIYKEE